MILEILTIGAAAAAVTIVPASLWFVDRFLKREHDAEKGTDPNARQRSVLQEAVKSAKVQLDKIPTYDSSDRDRFADRVTAAEQALLNFEQRVAKEKKLDEVGSR